MIHFFTDSRRVGDFGLNFLKILQVVEYLEQEENPSFEHAFQLAGMGTKQEPSSTSQPGRYGQCSTCFES